MKVNRILYIGHKITRPQSGGEQVNQRNQKFLEQICDGHVDYIAPTERFLLNKLFLGVNSQLIKDVNHAIKHNCYDYVFIDHSQLGRLVRFIKKTFPDLKIITFFHNIDRQYAYSYYKTIGVRALPFYFAVCYWEKITCLYSDIFITLNNRDSTLLWKVYHVHSNLELPTSFTDCFNEVKYKEAIAKPGPEIDYLFVGISFFANIQGVQWFIDNVMPEVSGNFYIIGSGMDLVRFNNLTDRIHVMGFVDDLTEYYYRAKFIVSPIFLGGGMKTKTAEALMYGKTIVGTTEAFEGYEVKANSTIMCNSKEEFITALNSVKPILFNTSSRQLFEENHNNEVLFKRMESLLCH